MASFITLAILAAASSSADAAPTASHMSLFSASAHADISTQNECNPQKKCNVCEACCDNSFPDGNECDKCVTTACSVVPPTPAPGPVADITWSYDFPDSGTDAGTLKTALAPGATVMVATDAGGLYFNISCSVSATTNQLQVHGVDHAGDHYDGQPTWQYKNCSTWSPDYGYYPGTMSCCSNHLPPPPKTDKYYCKVVRPAGCHATTYKYDAQCKAMDESTCKVQLACVWSDGPASKSCVLTTTRPGEQLQQCKDDCQ